MVPISSAMESATVSVSFTSSAASFCFCSMVSTHACVSTDAEYGCTGGRCNLCTSQTCRGCGAQRKLEPKPGDGAPAKASIKRQRPRAKQASRRPAEVIDLYEQIINFYGCKDNPEIMALQQRAIRPSRKSCEQTAAQEPLATRMEDSESARATLEEARSRTLALPDSEVTQLRPTIGSIFQPPSEQTEAAALVWQIQDHVQSLSTFLAA